MVRSFLYEHFRYLRFGNKDNRVFGKSIHFLSIALLEEIAVALTPLPVTLRECVEALFPHTVHMPEGMSEVNPFLCSITSDRAVKALTDAGEGLL